MYSHLSYEWIRYSFVVIIQAKDRIQV